MSIGPESSGVNGFRREICPACKRDMAEHSPSRRVEERQPGRISVILGRCQPDGEAAPQKLSWVAMREPITLEEYRMWYSDQPPEMEPCPGCGGRLSYHDRFPRQIDDEDAATTSTIFLYRGKCHNPDCPVVTVTHYPSFAIPYRSATVSTLEKLIQQRADGETWEALSAAFGYAISTLRRWVHTVGSRLGEIGSGLLALRQRFFPNQPLGIAFPPTEEPLGQLLRTAREVAKELSAIGLWKPEAPSLSLARLPGIFPSPLPVFT